jgi:ribosomal protein S12 methylthiotransferase
MITLGCPKNEVDSDRIASLLMHNGYREAESVEDAEILVVNTCSFIEKATEESIEVILDLAAEKEAGKRLLVTGCLYQRYGDRLGELLPEVDGFFFPDHPNGGCFPRLRGRSHRFAGDACARTRFSGSERGHAYLKISEGCSRACSFCTIPSIKGRLRSERAESILREAEGALSRGAREIVLVSQDTASYGRDLGLDAGLTGLLKSLVDLQGDFRVRVMYLQPEGVTDELLEMLNHPKVCRYLDIPLQHVCPGVLRRMGRAGGEEEFRKLADKARSRVPGIALRTSLMVGFPGEDRLAFKQLLDFVRDVRFDWVSVFTYSPEEGTRAASMRDGCSPETAARRAEMLREAQEEIMREKAASLKGTVVRALVEGPSEMAPGFLEARSCREAPDIDGVIFVGGVVPGPVPGFRRVLIEDSDGIDLLGRVIGEEGDGVRGVEG